MHLDVARELEPVVADALNTHYRLADIDWDPAAYVPWDEGVDFVERPWEPYQSSFSPEVRAALHMALATEDDLPAYRSSIDAHFGPDGPWGEWVRRWTAEETRHSRSLWAFLCATRGADPALMQSDTMATIQAGYRDDRKSILDVCVYVTVQELATRESHARTGRAAGDTDKMALRLLKRISLDENRHMLFYRRLVDAALEIDPSAALTAISREIRTFSMPGEHTVPAYRRRAALIARAQIYNIHIHHQRVIKPLVSHWRVFERTGLDAPAEVERELLAGYLTLLDQAAAREQEVIERANARRKALAC
ncbi:acyl-ACP desaturase [Streptomyces griseorubiginosus]|uniref:acyl-ACP desaturase n=1 Tax=Streptomyces griseorubiginosus TaxID=67304 RepID=UPI0036ED7B08